MRGSRLGLLIALLPWLFAAPLQVHAEDAEAQATTEESAGDATASDAADPNARAEPAVGQPLWEEEIARRALELEAREAALRTLEQDVLARIEELKKARLEAAAVLEPKQQQDEAEFRRLVRFYQSMKPGNAAGLIEQLPVQLASDLVSSMPARQAGKILDQMDRNVAVKISKQMAGE